MKDKRSEAERRKVKHERRASALFKQNEEANEQEDHTDEVDVEDARRPLDECAKVIEVGPVGADFWRVGRALS